MHCGVYYGSGESVRSIQTGCPFKPSVILIFGVGVSPEVWDKTLGKGFVYVGFASTHGTSNGVQLLDGRKTIKVEQESSGIRDEYVCLNERGIPYSYVCLR